MSAGDNDSVHPGSPETGVRRSEGAQAHLGSGLAPQAVEAVFGEIHPGDPTVWRPQSFAEWEGQQRAKTFLKAWSDQVADERKLRRGFAIAIYCLIAGQVLGVFGIVVAQGLGKLSPDLRLLEILLPSVLGEVFGFGYLVTKYLFSQPLRASLDSLAMGARPDALPPDVGATGAHR